MQNEILDCLAAVIKEEISQEIKTDSFQLLLMKLKMFRRKSKCHLLWDIFSNSVSHSVENFYIQTISPSPLVFPRALSSVPSCSSSMSFLFAHLFHKYNIDFCCYADDAQLYIYTKPKSTFPSSSLCDHLQQIKLLQFSSPWYPPKSPSIRSNWSRTLSPVTSPGLHPSIRSHLFQSNTTMAMKFTSTHSLVSLCFQDVCPPWGEKPSASLHVSGSPSLLTSGTGTPCVDVSCPFKFLTDLFLDGDLECLERHL